jgi:hypothetical protein
MPLMSTGGRDLGQGNDEVRSKATATLSTRIPARARKEMARNEETERDKKTERTGRDR